MDKKLLFFGGIFGPIVFLLNDIIGSIITQGYSPIINAVSELTQAGSMNIYLLSSLFVISATMLVVFGTGIISHYKFGQSKLLFLGGIFIIILGIFSALSGSIFPMDPFTAIPMSGTFAGTMHIILTGLNIVLIVLAIPMIGIGLYREKLWKSFRLYSIITVLIMISFGGLTSVLMMNNIELLGLFERITIYAYQSWIFILAFLFIKE
jgi:hypothetical protein